MSTLFSPLTIKDVTLKNRLVVSPMCMYSSKDGFANDWHLVHLGSRAVGGVGTILTEAAAVSAEGRITPQDLGIYDDDHIAGLKRITSFLEAQQTVPGIQLAHAGRKASHQRPWEGGAIIAPDAQDGWQTVAPSAIPFKPDEHPPVALDLTGIAKVKEDFKAAAQRALEAGFKIVEIHAAHGYLFHEFMSPLSNKRTDNYGGSFENRIRLLLEVIEEVKQVWPSNLPLFVRISASEWVEGGWDIDESVSLSKILKTVGVDVVDCSSGGNVPKAKIPSVPGYQVPFAQQVQQEAEILTGAVGLITTPAQAEQILQENQADLILMAREFLRNPYFPLHAATSLQENVAWPVQYERAKI